MSQDVELSAADKVVVLLDKINNKDDLQRISKRLKARWGELTEKEVNSFRKGQRVQFPTKSGRMLEGKIVRVNRKTCTVRTASGEYRVGPGLLEEVEGDSSTTPLTDLM